MASRPMPLLLADQVAVATTAGAPMNVDLNAQNMGAPFGRAMLLREVRFQIQRTDVAGTLDVDVGHAGHMLSVRMRMGRAVITNGFVPVWCLGTAMAANAELPGIPLTFSPEFISVAPYGGRVSAYRWIFPKPLFVPAGCPLTVDLLAQHFLGESLSGSRNYIVGVSFAGLLMPPGTRTPEKVWVPYASAYVGVDPAANVGVPFATAFETGQNDLGNRTNRDLEAQRLVGRVLGISTANSGKAKERYSVDNIETLVDTANPDAATAPLISIQSTTGYNLVPRATPWNMVFGSYRDLPLRYTMGAGESLIAKIASGSGSGLSKGQIQIGLIGQRQEPAGEI